ncbi:putative F-box/LRR-repeat protein [Raphanus sativus]|uniref:F-box/LRR-repeat protein At3g18150 n=1 Tax=Raphanus sativus TaxID=3726 RepID=A0A6J0M661_RAPSA|nr:putative F-box/LRR-repeat protein At3g18150 [Raphanus sativus]KAJ4913964.1 putative F-box/LRR-repeat protein [Raphanus sativus]
MKEERATASRRVRSRRSHGGDRRLKVKGETISGLPDVILQHILTYIPTKYAIRTLLLSKRWRNVWCDTPSLSFNCSELNDAWINQTPTGYTAPKMMHFHLKSAKKHDVPHIDKWLEFVMSRRVENMSLSFWLAEYNIPEFFYVSSSLKQLTLKFCGMSPKCSVSWTSLKNLSLTRCSVSDESMAKILSGCPVLESLTLNNCHELIYLDLSRSLRLRTLVVEESSSSVAGRKDIEAPHIHYLYLRSHTQLPCTLVDVSSLTEANVNICTNVLPYKVGSLQPTVMNMLEKLQHVEKLTFGGNLLQVLSVAQHRGVPFPMFKVKALTLETRIFRYVIPGIKMLLQNSHDLKKLTVHTIHCDIELAKRLDHILSSGFNKALLCLRSEDAVHWNVKSKHLLLFVELVLKNTKTLDKMFLVLDHRYRMFRKIIRTLSRNEKSPLSSQNRLVVNHRV